MGVCVLDMDVIRPTLILSVLATSVSSRLRSMLSWPTTHSLPMKTKM